MALNRDFTGVQWLVAHPTGQISFTSKNPVLLFISDNQNLFFFYPAQMYTVMDSIKMAKQPDLIKVFLSRARSSTIFTEETGT